MQAHTDLPLSPTSPEKRATAPAARLVLLRLPRRREAGSNGAGGRLVQMVGLLAELVVGSSVGGLAGRQAGTGAMMRANDPGHVAAVLHSF